MGIDKESKGVRIYWPDTKLVNVEQNVYYDKSSASRFEGEQDNIVVMKTDLLAPITSEPVKNPSTNVEIEVKVPNPKTPHRVFKNRVTESRIFLKGRGAGAISQMLSVSFQESSYLPSTKQIWWIGPRMLLTSMPLLLRRQTPRHWS